MKKEKSYAEKLKDPRWQKKRLEIMKRDRFTCRLCKDDETELQVHHKEYISGNDPWDYDNKLLITLCSHCHQEIEKLNKEYLDLVFEDIKIYKSDNWAGGDRIMFTSFKNICSMSVYDENDEWICGYSFEGELFDIIKIFKHAYNG